MHAIFAKIATFQRAPLPSHLHFFTLWRFWRLIAISPKYAIFAKIATFQRAPLLSHFNYCLLILAIKRQFCHFRQIRHFRQNRHFPKGPFAISFEFLFIVWRFWRLIAISAIFAEIATFQRAPLPSHLNFCLQFGDFGD